MCPSGVAAPSVRMVPARYQAASDIDEETRPWRRCGPSAPQAYAPHHVSIWRDYCGMVDSFHCFLLVDSFHCFPLRIERHSRCYTRRHL